MKEMMVMVVMVGLRLDLVDGRVTGVRFFAEFGGYLAGGAEIVD